LWNGDTSAETCTTIGRGARTTGAPGLADDGAGCDSGDGVVEGTPPACTTRARFDAAPPTRARGCVDALQRDSVGADDAFCTIR
jgi:hypothetical protein